MNRTRIFPFLALALAALVAGCATNPASKNPEFVLMSEAEELKLGQQMAADVEKNLTLLADDDPLNIYVEKVGQRVAKTADRTDLFFHFQVVDDSTINAFALPGGFVYIHRGLIDHLDSEAELAAVLGHEIGHITARHAVKQYTKAQGYQMGMVVASIFVPGVWAVSPFSDLFAMILIRGYGRDAEFQSDELSLEYIRRAGYDVHATANILKTLERLDAIDQRVKKEAGEKTQAYHGAFATHPETKKRIEEAIAKVAAEQGTTGEVNREGFLAMLDGQPYANSSKEGAVIDHRFIHPKLDFALNFSERWSIHNGQQLLTARVKQQEVYFQLSFKKLQKRHTAAEILASLFKKRHTGPIGEGEQDGFRFAQAEVEESAPHVSYAKILATVYLDGDKCYATMLWSKRDEFDANRADFLTLAKSFRHYDKARDGDVLHIQRYVWKSGDSWPKLAAESKNVLGSFTTDRLAAMNGYDPDVNPPAGTPIKIVR